MDQYWASLDREEIAPELFSRIDNNFKTYDTSVQHKVLRRSYRYYYGISSEYGQSFGHHEIRPAGQQGEYSAITVNHFRNILQHLLVLTTSQRLALECRATNSDYESQSQCILGNGILDYYMKEKRLEDICVKACEYALVFGDSYGVALWDPTRGKEYAVDDGKPVKTGDVRYQVFSPLDTIKDTSREGELDWIIFRDYENRWDLIAKHPEIKEDILSVETRDELTHKYSLSGRSSDIPTEDVPVYHFFHRRTPSMPMGRYTILASDNVILYDGPLPYRGIPVAQMKVSDFIGSSHGYTPAFDLLALQEQLNHLYSVVVTNQLAFGVQNIIMPKGHGIAVSQLAGGLNLLEYDSKLGKPEPLNLVQTPAEIFNFIGSLKQDMEMIAGLNSVVRGEPEASLKSGAALALVASQAVQFNSGLQRSYNNFTEKMGSMTVKLLQDFAKVPMIAMIAGKFSRPYVKEFIGDDLKLIDRVIVETASPISRTTAGKVDMANQLLQTGMVKTPDEYISVINTGKIEPMIEGQQSELLLIRSENEAMRAGEPVPAVATDQHALHIQEHRSVLANPESRKNEMLVKLTLAHIQEHINQLRQTEPELLQLLGEQPLPPKQPEAAVQPPPPQEGEVGQPMAGGPVPIEVSDPMLQEQLPNMPTMPINPATGEQYNPEAGI